jgi:hypothetical protein
VPGFALDLFEPRAEAFLQSRQRREYQFLTGFRPGRGLVGLYDDDFPEFTSTDFWADFQAATPDDPRQHTRLSALLGSAYLEGRTREFAVGVTRVFAGATVPIEGQDLPWREAPARWPLIGEVSRRHELEDAWRGVFRSELAPQLERWQEALRSQLPLLGTDDWLAFWSRLRGFDTTSVSRLATTILDETADVYGNSLGVYLGQLDLPIDDVWPSDVDWAFRAPRFDSAFPERTRLPTLIRVLRDLGIELEDQAEVRLEYGPEPGVRCLPVEVPDEIRVLQRLIGGWQDLAGGVDVIGRAEHLAHTDASLRFWERWLGDGTPTVGYGLMLEALLRDRTWLMSRLDYAASDDFRVIAHLARLYRLRRIAATALFEQRLWQAEPGASMAADYEESLGVATRARHFGDEYTSVLLESPWSTLRPAMLLRAEVFAVQVRTFLQHEFDEEWWRSGRAAHFIKDELWRPGRRSSAEELLGFMGYEGFDPALLVSEVQEMLQPL